MEALLILTFVCHLFSQDSYGQSFDDSYLGLDITYSQPFRNIFFCEHIFYFVLYAPSLFLSFIAKGLAMCRLGGVISAQKVLF